MIQTIDNQGVLASKGFLAGAAACGIKKSGNPDVVVIFASIPLTGIGMVGTQNIVCAPSVVRNRTFVAQGDTHVRGIVINAGCANVATGLVGIANNNHMASSLSHLIDGEALTASTGVIGVQLPMDKLISGINQAFINAGSSHAHDVSAACGIMTTDLVPKSCAVAITHDNTQFRIGGIAKGSGMIAPNMATMLGFITTDANISSELLQKALVICNARTFNAITVDGDTSTSDQCIILASGCSLVKVDTLESPVGTLFLSALERVLLSLAKSIARDGEGATKLIAVTVNGAQTDDDACRVAKTIAESPLVKTALFGNDPNWGRLMMAAGRAGVHFDPLTATASIAGYKVYQAGLPANFDATQVSEAMKQPDVKLHVDLGTGGDGSFTFYTCDFSYDYIRINAEYTT